MDRSIRLLLLSTAIALSVSARGELQLIPALQEFEGDGSKYTVLAFSDGDKPVTYQAPTAWDYSGDGTQLTLRPPNKPQAEATVSRIPLAQSGSFDDEALEKLVNAALALLPKGSEDVTVISQEKNPLMIDRKETFLLRLSYSFYGQKYGRSILFLNREDEQIRFQLTCLEADFEELDAVFQHSQYSWQGL